MQHHHRHHHRAVTVVFGLTLGALVASGCSSSSETSSTGTPGGPTSAARPRPGVAPPASGRGTPPPVVAPLASPVGFRVPAPPTSEPAAHTSPRTAPATRDTVPPAVPAVDIMPDAVTFADGETAYRDRHYGRATTLFTRYTDQHPDNPWGHFMRGLSAWNDGDPTAAETAFATALSLDPRHQKSLENLARVLIQQDRIDEAIGTLDTARDADPTSSTVHRLLGRAHQTRGDAPRAVDAYRRAIALDPDDAWSMNNLGLVLLDERRPSDAVPALARAVARRPDMAVFRNNLAMALEHAGQFTAAAEMYGAAVDLDPTHEKAVMNLARVGAVEDDAPATPFDLDEAGERFAADMALWHDGRQAEQ